MSTVDEHTALESAFIAGLRAAADKQAFLALTGVPLTLGGADGGDLKLIEVAVTDRFRVGSAAPGFGTRELSYLPLPERLVSRSTRLAFVYVSADAVIERSLAELRNAKEHQHVDGHSHGHSHDHPHHHERHHR